MSGVNGRREIATPNAAGLVVQREGRINPWLDRNVASWQCFMASHGHVSKPHALSRLGSSKRFANVASPETRDEHVGHKA